MPIIPTILSNFVHQSMSKVNSALKLITPVFENHNGNIVAIDEIISENLRNSLDCFKQQTPIDIDYLREQDKNLIDNFSNQTTPDLNEFLDSFNNNNIYEQQEQNSNNIIIDDIVQDEIDPIKYYLNSDDSEDLQSTQLQQQQQQPEYQIEQSRLEMNFYLFKVIGWLIAHDPIYVTNNDFSEIKEHIQYSLQCAKNMLEAHEIPILFFPIIIFYADKFVKRCGINSKQVFNLLLSASILCVKYHGESVLVDYKIIGKHFHYSPSDLCLMERLFLKGVDYELYVNSPTIYEFLDNIDQENQKYQ